MITKIENHSTLVSIVMPTYNRAHLLPSVIESILNQDFQDLELVIIDDGSTDDTSSIIKEMQARDSRIRYVLLPQNRGLGFARDIGLRHAYSPYIALADSDDLWMQGRLQKQVEVLQAYPEIDILFGDFWNINHLNGTRSRMFENSPGLREIEARFLEKDLFLIERGLEVGILISNFIGTPTMVLRQSVLDCIGGFDIQLAASDIEFCWRASVLGAQYAYIDAPLLERHIHSDSMSTQRDIPWLERLDAIEVMYRTCKWLKQQDLIPQVRGTEIRTYCNLLRIYGETNQRSQVIRTYLDSLKRGWSKRTLSWFLVALLGSRALSEVLDKRGGK